MKLRTVLLALLIFPCWQAIAQNLTERNVARVNEIIEAAEQAHGGEQLSALTSMRVKTRDVNYAVGQSLKPTPPWDKNRSEGFAAVDLENRIFVNQTQGEGGGFDFRNGTIINGDKSFQVNYRSGTAQPIAEPDFDNASGPFIRVTPPLLVRQLREHLRTAHYLGQVNDGDEVFEVVAFSMAVGPSISLYFDAASHVLKRSERVFAGFGLVQYRFDDYKTVSGISVNDSFTLILNGDVNMQRSNLATEINPDLSDMLVVDPRLAVVEPIVPAPLERQELADGVYLIGGAGTYALFVEMSDHVIAIGGTAGIPARIELLREVVADKPIKYGVLTHHHSDHVVGVAPYLAAGATVVAAAAHRGAVSDAAGDESLRFKGVKGSLDLSDESRKVQVVDIGPTAHTEHLLVTWLPDQGVLFEADHFARPVTGPILPAVESTRSFARALKRLNLNPERIVSAHSPRPGTAAELRQAVNAQPVSWD
ncbi:MAG: MBL fold metallo-hydrolase [Lysobacterales bacterium]